MAGNRYGAVEWRRRDWICQLNALYVEIARMVSFCGLPLPSSATIARVLRKDPTIVKNTNGAAFEKLRALITMYLIARRRLAQEIGRDGARVLVRQALEELGRPLPSTNASVAYSSAAGTSMSMHHQGGIALVEAVETQQERKLREMARRTVLDNKIDVRQFEQGLA